jgi:DNA repair protein RadC
MDTPHAPKVPLQKIPVYEIRLVQARRALRLAEATVSDPPMAAKTLHAMLGLTDREHFAVLFLDGRHNVNGAHVAAIGNQHGITGIEPRIVFRAAVVSCAAAIICGHNHPSGDPTPSEEDITTTAKLMAAGKLVGIPVVDHVIVTKDSRRWHSMMARGTMPFEE